MDHLSLRTHIRLLPPLLGETERRVRQEIDLYGWDLRVHRWIYYLRILTQSVPDAHWRGDPGMRGGDGFSLHSLDPDHNVQRLIAQRSFMQLGLDRQGVRGSG